MAKAIRNSGSNCVISNSLACCIRRAVLVETDEAVDVGVDECERVVQSDLFKGDNVRQADVGIFRVELNRCIVRVHLPEVRQVSGVEQEGLCGESVANLFVGREGWCSAARVLSGGEAGEQQDERSECDLHFCCP